MSIPLPLQEAYTVAGAQDALRSALSSALAAQSGVSALNLSSGFSVDQQGIVVPSVSFLDNLVLPSVRAAVQPWLGTDAWTTTRILTTEAYAADNTFQPSPDVAALYVTTGALLPDQVQVQVPATTTPQTTDTTTAETAATDQTQTTATTPLQPPLLPFPSTGPSPLTLVPSITGASGVTPFQGTTQWADWLRTQAAVALHELIQYLQPVLPPIFEEQLQLTQAEQDVLRASAALTEPIVVGLQRVTELMQPAQEAIDAGLVTPLEQVRADLAEVSARVREQVIATLGAASEAIDAGRSVAIAPVVAALDDAQNSLAEVAGLLEATAAEKIANAQELIANAMAETVSSDQAMVDWFQSLIPNPETFIQDIVREVRGQCEDLPVAVAEAVQNGFAGGLNANLNGPIGNSLPDLLGGFLNACGNLTNTAIGGAAVGLLAAVVTGGGAAALELLGGLFNMLVVQGLTAQVLAAALAPNLEVTTQDAFAACPVRVASLTNAATAKRLGVINDAQYTEIARKNGYNDFQAIVETANQRQLLSTGEAISWSVRQQGLADAAGSTTLAPTTASMAQIRDRANNARPLLQEQGYSQQDIDKLLDLAPYVPPVTDLLMFDKKDVFDPVVREQFQLFDEFPEEILPLTRMQGIPDEIVRLYHGASWTSPSNTQMYDMYHRVTDEPLTPDSPPVYVDGQLIGYRLISQEMVDAVFRNNDVLKVFRQPLLSLSERPLTRVDTRRAFILGAIDERQVLKSYIQQGYSPENAKVMLDFNKVEKERSLLTEVGEQRRAVATAFASAYERGVLDESSYSFALTDLGYDPQTAALAVTRSRLERQLVYLRDVLSAVRTRFIKGKIDRDGAIAILSQVGINATEIERNIGVWCYQIGCDDTGTVQEKEREVTKSEILSFYDDGLIGAQTATDRIVSLGYQQADAELSVANAQIKRLRANLKATIKATHDNYLSNTITRLDASNELDAIGVPQETRDIMLDQWDQEREQAEIKRAREAYLSSGDHEQEARGILATIGLPQDEVDRLIELWAAQKAVIDATTPPLVPAA